MADIAGDAPRNKRLRPEAIDELFNYRIRLTAAVKLHILDADAAMRSYSEMLARIVRDPAQLMDDFREWAPVRCRRCNRPTSVAKGVDQWSCICTPYITRFTATDVVGPDGEYMVDPYALPVGA